LNVVLPKTGITTYGIDSARSPCAFGLSRCGHLQHRMWPKATKSTLTPSACANWQWKLFILLLIINKPVSPEIISARGMPMRLAASWKRRRRDRVVYLYHQTSPQSHFTHGRICSRATPDGRVTLGEMRLIITRNGEREERTLTDEEEYAATLRDRFEGAL